MSATASLGDKPISLFDVLDPHERRCLKARTGADDEVLRRYPDVGEAWRAAIEAAARSERIELRGEPGRVLFPWGAWYPGRTR